MLKPPVYPFQALSSTSSQRKPQPECGVYRHHVCLGTPGSRASLLYSASLWHSLIPWGPGSKGSSQNMGRSLFSSLTAARFRTEKNQRPIDWVAQ